jgi:hypothetical protein
MHNQTQNQVMQSVRTLGVKRGEWQNDKIHYLLDGGTEEQPAHNWVISQESQTAACRVVNRRCRAGDKEVQDDTQNVSANASVEGAPPQQSGGNHERNVPSK